MHCFSQRERSSSSVATNMPGMQRESNRGKGSQHRKTVRYGSFLENSHLKLRDFIMLTHLWSSNGTVKMAGKYLHLSKKTIIVWFKLYRDICSKWMAANQPIIGGAGHIVQVDEAVISRAKYHRGRRVRKRWVFGGCDTTTKDGLLRLNSQQKIWRAFCICLEVLSRTTTHFSNNNNLSRTERSRIRQLKEVLRSPTVDEACCQPFQASELDGAIRQMRAN